MTEIGHEVDESVCHESVGDGQQFGNLCSFGVGHVGEQERSHVIFQGHRRQRVQSARNSTANTKR